MDDLVSKIGAFAVAFVFSLSPKHESVANIPEQVANPIVTIEDKYDFEKKDKHCLAVMIYGEAKGESFYGKAGVAWTAINRFNSYYYNSICDVVLNPDQYHAFQSKDLVQAASIGSIPKKANKAKWEESLRVAELAYDDIIPDPTYGAKYFLNPAKIKKTPRWVFKLKRKVVIGNHHFYG